MKAAIALKTEFKRLESYTAWQDNNGNYHVLGKYRIRVHDTGYTVEGDGVEMEFGSKRAAIVWCTADYCQDRNLAISVRNIDAEISRTRQDIELRSSVQGDSEFKQMVGIKLEHKISRLQDLRYQLSRCVRIAKHYQRGIVK